MLMFAVSSRLHMFHSQKGRKYSECEGKKIVLEQLITAVAYVRQVEEMHRGTQRCTPRIKFNKEAKTSRLILQGPKTQLEPQL